MISIHLFGAGLTFGPGTLYILIQTGMSYRMQPRFHGRGILWARMAVGMWTLFSIITRILSSIYNCLYLFIIRQLCQYLYLFCFFDLSVFISFVLLYDDLPGVDVPNKLHWERVRQMMCFTFNISKPINWK